MCSSARYFTVTVPLSYQVHKWVPTNLMLGLTLQRTSIKSRRNRNTPLHFMLQKLNINASLIGYFACSQNFYLWFWTFKNTAEWSQESSYHSNIEHWLLLASTYCRAPFCCLNGAQLFYYCALGSSHKLGGASKHMIYSAAKNTFCRLSFEFSSLHVI